MSAAYASASRLPNGTRRASGVPSNRVHESRLSYSTPWNPFSAHLVTIGFTHAAAARRRLSVLRSTRYSPPHLGSSPSLLNTSRRGQFERSSGQTPPAAPPGPEFASRAGERADLGRDDVPVPGLRAAAHAGARDADD